MEKDQSVRCLNYYAESGSTCKEEDCCHCVNNPQLDRSRRYPGKWCSNFIPSSGPEDYQQEFKIEFCITGLSEKQVDCLYDEMISKVDRMGGRIGGGGVSKVVEKEDAEKPS